MDIFNGVSMWKLFLRDGITKKLIFTKDILSSLKITFIEVYGYVSQVTHKD